MSIVHAERTYSHESEKGSGVFVSVAVSIFGKTEGEVSVTFWGGGVNFMVMRAVHGFEIVFLVVEFHGGKHVFCIIGEVPRTKVEGFFGDVRASDSVVAVFEFYFFGEVFEDFYHGGAFGKPEGKTWTDFFVEGEEF